MRTSNNRYPSPCRMLRWALLPALLVLALQLAGCATVQTRENAPKREIQWPPLPMDPRIVWVDEIYNYQDVGIAKGFWKRMTEFFAGEEDTSMGKPYGVFFDERQRLFVVDVAYAMVHVMDRKEKRYYVIGEGKENVFRSPIAVTEDDADNLYITDSGAATVYRYNLKDKKLHPFIVSDLGRPTGIAFNRQNRLLYITDTTSHQVAVFDLRGNIRFRIGSRGAGAGQFNYPTDLFVDHTGRLYVTDALNARVSIFSGEGAFLRSFGSPGDSVGSFAKPKGVAVDRSGNIYVCDALLDAVQIFNPQGQLLLAFGGNGTDAGQFWMPAGIYIDGDNNIYVSDTYNRRVQLFKYLDIEGTSRTGGGVPEPAAK